MSIEPEDITRIQGLLSQYFDHDQLQRFSLEGCVGYGSYGITWKVKYKGEPVPTTGPAASPGRAEAEVRRLVLKTSKVYANFDENYNAFENSPDPNHELEEEKQWLSRLQWALHIVHLETPPNDPLTKTFTGVRPHFMNQNNWYYMEWLEKCEHPRQLSMGSVANLGGSGVLKDFIGRAQEEGIEAPLPNRILWRFFLCLLRTVIAMAWPPLEPAAGQPRTPQTEHVQQGVDPSRMFHGDMHDENIMFGDVLADDEHLFTPILKLIDFGSMEEEPLSQGGFQASSLNDNLFDVAVIMLQLITLDPETHSEVNRWTSQARPFNVRLGSGGGGRVRPGPPTAAYPLLPPAETVIGDAEYDQQLPLAPRLDRQLRDLVCLCLAMDARLRPKVSQAVNVARNAVLRRDANWYAARGVPGESDAEVRACVERLLLQARAEEED
ncbi:hypothetical protein GGR56DRAFT_673406 [Xylariaceae sp. FL0804]|nr:hypothetical protein GGR56DRAFT_673406 [Xylariaceae sp. FL0804]